MGFYQRILLGRRHCGELCGGRNHQVSRKASGFNDCAECIVDVPFDPFLCGKFKSSFGFGVVHVDGTVLPNKGNMPGNRTAGCAFTVGKSKSHGGKKRLVDSLGRLGLSDHGVAGGSDGHSIRIPHWCNFVRDHLSHRDSPYEAERVSVLCRGKTVGIPVSLPVNFFRLIGILRTLGNSSPEGNPAIHPY